MASDKQHAEDIVIGPMPDAREPPTATKQTRAAQVQAALLCGVINSIITIPVMTSFAAIIFQVRISLLTPNCLHCLPSVQLLAYAHTNTNHTHLASLDKHMPHARACLADILSSTRAGTLGHAVDGMRLITSPLGSPVNHMASH